jgi:pimeloyl-ACP methyl ester carboxylesterase
MGFRHCTVAILVATTTLGALLGVPARAGAQQVDGRATFRVFLRGAAVGGEEVTVRRTAAGTSISSNGRLAPPLDMVTRQFLVHYDTAWHPLDLTIEAVSRGAAISIKSTFANGQASSEVVQAGAPTRKVDTVAPDTIVLPNLFFASYEALALRLASIPDGSTFKAYIAPQAEIVVKQTARSTQQVETAKRVIQVRAYGLTFQNPGSPLDAIVWTDEVGRLLKFEVVAQSLIFVREDLASVATRALVMSRAGDSSVRISGNGFNLTGTLSQPSGTPPADSKGRWPAVVLLAGSGPTDRDEIVSGIPIFGLLATPLADAGMYVLRYDKRGVGQSGGRGEAATLDDYAEDAAAVVEFLRRRKDVDPKRIVLVGHSEGALVALLAASRDEDLAGLVLMAAPSGTGGELVLEQQQYLLAKTALSDAEKAARIDLQKRIQAAVLGQGTWDDIPEPLKRQADTPWFASFLRFSPAAVMPKVKQPILVLQGDLDRQVPVYHADRLGALAAARKKVPATAVQVTKVPGVNHLLVQAITGELDEYARLTGKGLDPRVAQSIVEWLKKTLEAKR